ncbi:hypothetical protein LSTR_LSTR010953 [Laodelphax striatellus]|uniref:Lipase n=1 Tax=Laodelphax striatellus TaxID=195883 RepID=A0A482XT81_LAOST|nr:hypothetical protein LSTR_LSTR010953 [Laodelphax striatellus]
MDLPCLVIVCLCLVQVQKSVGQLQSLTRLQEFGLGNLDFGARLQVPNTSALIEKEGFNSETHKAEAEDGFQVHLSRIPSKGVPVLMNHGLFIASDAWLLRGRDKDLAFLLAESGYDVWMGDLRGNTYSSTHKNLTQRDPKFWDFSVQEMGTYDLPASIDYILATTGHDSVIYIGHSLGSTMYFVMCSERPEYRSKVRLMMGLAPAIYFKRSPGLLFKIARQYSRLYQESISFRGPRQVLPRNQLRGATASLFCRSAPTQNICLVILYFLAGLASLTDFSQVDKNLLPEFVRRLPTGTSPKTLQHLGQMSKSGRFCKFDYGPKENMRKYGTKSPPDYKLDSVTGPVALYYGKGDILIDVQDVAEVTEKLPNLVRNFTVANDKFNHMDFLWAKNAKQLVYDDMLKLMKLYT